MAAAAAAAAAETDDVDSVMASVQAILEIVAASFAAAAPPAAAAPAAARWPGLPADERQRVDALARAEVNRLRAVLLRAGRALDASPGLRLSARELDEMACEQDAREAALDRLLAVLPADPASITALSGEAERLREHAEAIGWPGSGAFGESGGGGGGGGGGRER
jgi:hypothetical protein